EEGGSGGVFLGATLLTAVLMEYRRTTQGKSQAKGMSNLLCQGHRLLALCQPLVRIAEVPQRPGRVAVTNHTSVVPIAERRGAVLRGVVERHTLRKVRVC